MNAYEKEIKLWKEICDNCPSDDEYFYGVFSGVWSDTYKYVSQADTLAGKFALALCTKDMEAIEKLYSETPLTEYQKQKIEDISKNNVEYKSTLNVAILDEKYDFLDDYLDLIIIDTALQERLLSLDDKTLELVKMMFGRILEYEINPCNILYRILEVVGKRVISAWNIDDQYTYRELRENIVLDELTVKDIDNLIFLFSVHYYLGFKDVSEFKNLGSELKEIALNTLKKSDDIEELKNDFLSAVYGFGFKDAKLIVDMFSMDDIPDKYKDEKVVFIYDVIKSIVEIEDIDLLRNVCTEFLQMYDLECVPYRKDILIEKLKVVYAKSFNDCCVTFDDSLKKKEMDGVTFYQLGTEFILKAKVIGAFSDDGKNTDNYYDEWNDARYRTHLNAMSLIANDNLCLAKGAESSVIIGFNNIDKRMLATMYHSDNNSVVDSRKISYNLFWNHVYFAFPRNFINHTRQSHNEMDYERQDFGEDATNFKKNPDFVIYVHEAIDSNNLSEEMQYKQNVTFEMSMKAAKEFGDIPVLIINREKCAISEKNKMDNLLNLFTETKDYRYAHELIIKFANNRNGSREGHEYIRNTYFSNKIFGEYMDIIVNHVKDEDVSRLIQLLESEEKATNNNLYDRTFDLPYVYYINELKSKLQMKE